MGPAFRCRALPGQSPPGREGWLQYNHCKRMAAAGLCMNIDWRVQTRNPPCGCFVSSVVSPMDVSERSRAFFFTLR